MRMLLKDLKSSLSGNNDFRKALDSVLKNDEQRVSLLSELKGLGETGDREDAHELC